VNTSSESRDIFLDIYNQNGEFLTSCSVWDACTIEQPEEGLYYALVIFMEDVSNISITSAWGGPDFATLDNGSMLGDLSGSRGETLAQSFYLPAETSSFLVSATLDRTDLVMDVYDQRGNSISSSSCFRQRRCVIENPEEGLYYAVLTLNQDSSDFSMVATWAGPSVAALENGTPVTVSGPSNYEGAHSLYIASSGATLDLQVSGGLVELEVLDAAGRVLSDCSSDIIGNCSLVDLPVGVYYVITLFTDDLDNLTLSASW